MQNRNLMDWMLSEAIDSLARAERLHRQFFQLRSGGGMGEPSWQPPVIRSNATSLLFFKGYAPDAASFIVGNIQRFIGSYGYT
jgi:hypothetical protein